MPPFVDLRVLLHPAWSDPDGQVLGHLLVLELHDHPRVSFQIPGHLLEDRQSDVVGAAILLQISLHANWMSTLSDAKKLHLASRSEFSDVRTCQQDLICGIRRRPHHLTPLSTLHTHLLQNELDVLGIRLDRNPLVPPLKHPAEDHD